MARNLELDALKQREQVAFQRKQTAFQKYKDAKDRASVAYDIMQTAWVERSSAREKMNREFETMQRASDNYREVWDRYKYIRDCNNSRIESLRYEADREHEMMKNCFDQASAAYEYGSKSEAPIMVVSVKVMVLVMVILRWISSAIRLMIAAHLKSMDARILLMTIRLNLILEEVNGGELRHGWINDHAVTWCEGVGTNVGQTLICDGHVDRVYFDSHHDHYGPDTKYRSGNRIEDITDLMGRKKYYSGPGK